MANYIKCFPAFRKVMPLNETFVWAVYLIVRRAFHTLGCMFVLEARGEMRFFSRGGIAEQSLYVSSVRLVGWRGDLLIEKNIDLIEHWMKKVVYGGNF